MTSLRAIVHFLLQFFVYFLKVQGTLFTAPNQLTKTEYDFVIVGAGAAGNVLASRLTENPKFSVLVVEAGITNEGILASVVPFLAPTLSPNTPVCWNYTTTLQPGLGNRSVPYPRGRVLGGSSSINYQLYTRGSSDDFDRFAKVTGDKGWSWNSLIPYIKKGERLVPPADHRDTTGQVDPAVHGNGPLEVSLSGLLTGIDFRVINTTKELGHEFPFNLDHNSGNTIGISWMQSTVGESKRSSSATAYLDPALGRPNLDVLIHTQVIKLHSTGKVKNLPTFKTVEIAQTVDGVRTNVTAKNEVILSAGAVGTPQILMLSGIGDPASLKSVGVQALVNLPDVGQHLQDHPVLAIAFPVNFTGTFDEVFQNTTFAAQALQQWNSTGQGIFSDTPDNTIAFLRLPNNSPIFKNFSDPSAGPKSGHYELLFASYARPGTSGVPVNTTGHFITVGLVVVSPASVGSMALASSDPFAFPTIDPGFLTSKFDVFTFVEAYKSTRRFLNASVWKDIIIGGPLGPLANATTDDEIAAFIRSQAMSIKHPVGTARMSPAHAKWGVVDPSLLVKGVSGLRVVDASIFPEIPAAHTVGPTYIIAERAADLVKAAWSK
ncbi:aryl-alcohol-oxidase from pleurotus Eryingii [Rickenella mellea]|uniref:Aryl-alcohol-oxidase from pleurotus Eryingii n=1 Tax=Rickenella mellea TaxID=50990 RepID=A0A4Y7QPW5_9AGAM|nr:aryl-alcohol-oxidase from pleurotus Eryingii [Rickenella mellea]